MDGDIGYDEYDAMVVSAYTEGSARVVACLRTGEGGDEPWRNPNKTMVTELGDARDKEHEQIILGSFNAG
jgi:hypothetical protein